MKNFCGFCREKGKNGKKDGMKTVIFEKRMF